MGKKVSFHCKEGHAAQDEDTATRVSCVPVPEFHAQGPVPLAHLLHAGLHLSTVDLLLLIRHPLGRTCSQSALGIHSPAGPAALGKAPVVINVRWASTPTRPLYADGTS